MSGEPREMSDEDRGMVSERWREVEADDLTPRQREQRRLADRMRTVIDRLVATSAPEEALRYAADSLERLAAEFEQYPQGNTYEGFAEAANAGGDQQAFFDHSPLIGLANPLSPPVVIRVEDDHIDGRVTFGAAYEGPPGCVHGGYIAAAFDEVLGSAQSLGGRPGMTGTLTIRYRSPTPLHRPLRFEAAVTGVDGRKIFTTGSCFADDVLTAEAEGIFISIDRERVEELLALRDGTPD
ncbi:MAG: PaaI family thioesterase [Acidimicrobiales bacterium]